MKIKRTLDATIAVILTVIIILFVSPSFGKVFGVYGTVAAELLMVMVPATLILFRGEKISERFNLRLPSIRSFFSAVLLMLGVNMWENAATFVYVGIFGMPKETDMTYLERYFSNIDPMVALVVIALVPAICEELLFRGYIFDSFKGKKNKAAAVIVSGVLFSAIHFDLFKLAPLLIMGIALGYITAKTGSVLLPMIFHFLNNSMSLIALYSQEPGQSSAMTLEMSGKAYIWCAVAAFALGSVFVWFGVRKLAGKPKNKRLNRLVWISCILLFVVSSVNVASDMVGTPYMGEYSDTLREDTVYEERFTLEKDCMGTVSARVICDDEVSYTIIITDSENKEIYNSSAPQGDSGIPLKKGEYTVTYSFDIPEEKSIAYDVAAAVEVVTVEGISISNGS